uniref:Uncharacterized protein n=1 Tax=Rhizophora mucronata TaxID=61149 RepID=A0A2P2NKT9_RHIMU
MFFCNASSLASDFGTHHFLAGFEAGPGAAVPELGP